MLNNRELHLDSEVLFGFSYLFGEKALDRKRSYGLERFFIRLLSTDWVIFFLLRFSLYGSGRVMFGKNFISGVLLMPNITAVLGV